MNNLNKMNNKKRIKVILSIFYDSGQNPSTERFEEMFKYYFNELNLLFNQNEQLI